MTATPVLVSYDDVEALRAHLSPGSVILSVHLYPRYVTVMESVGKHPASREALGRALARAGWGHRSIHRSAGPRGRQRETRSHAWVVPGARPISEEDDRMVATLRAALDGKPYAFVPEQLIHETHSTLARQRGWSAPENTRRVNRWLNDRGFVRVTHGGRRGRGGWRGVPSRYVDSSKIDMISPPRCDC